MVMGFNVVRRLRPSIGIVAAALLAGVPLTAAGDEPTPQTGGHVNVLTAYRMLDALSWDAQQWPWKINHDHLGMETLVRGDLSQGVRGGGSFEFGLPDHIPESLLEGALAERWEVKDDRLVFHLRTDVEWMAIPGVMERRPLVAEDVIYNFEVLDKSPRANPEIMGFIERWEAPDEHTVVAHLNRFNANWHYDIGWGFRGGIFPPEWHDLGAEERAMWERGGGTGPYRVADVSRGRHQRYEANPTYWDTENIGGTEYSLPLNEGVTYHVVRDESAAIAALVSGNVDIMEQVRWQFIDQIRESAPEIEVRERLDGQGVYMALRNDQPPFDDVRVRRAMNLGVDQRAILNSLLDGRGELLNYPFSVEFDGYYQPLEELPAAAQELFDYKPDRARELLAEAGYPDGFEFDVQISAFPSYYTDIATMMQAYYERIGVTMKVQTLDYPVHISQMRRDSQAPGYLMSNTSGNPIAALRKTFVTGQNWNAARHSDEYFDAAFKAAEREPDREVRRERLRELNRYIMTERVPHVWLPTEMHYVAWWPWVKNYWGETRVGANMPNAIYARIWIDEDEKARLRPGR